MKLPRFLAPTLVGMVLSAPIAFAEMDAFTPPIGNITFTLAPRSDTRIALALDRPPAYQGRVAAVNGASLTLFHADLEANQFVFQSETSANPSDTHYALFVTGAHRGRSVRITSNSETAITLETPLNNINADPVDPTGDLVQIVPYWTPASLFANAWQKTGIAILLFANEQPGINKSSSEIFTYFPAPNAWGNSKFQQVDHAILTHESSMVIRNVSNATITLPLNGSVRMAPKQLTIPSTANTQEMALSLGSATPISLDRSGLGIADRVTVFTFSGTSFNEAFDRVFTYIESSDSWVDESLEPANSTTIPAGAGIVVRIPANVTATAVTPAPNYLD